MMQNENIDSAIETPLDPNTLIRLNSLLSSDKDFSRNMVYALKIIGNFGHSERVHIVQIHKNMTFSICYEWNVPAYPPVKETIKSRHILYDKQYEQQLCTQNYITICHTDTVSNEEFKELMQHLHCYRLLLLPLFEAGAQFAFLACMRCSECGDWKAEEIQSLSQLSSVIAVNWSRKQLVRQLLNHIVRKKKTEEQIFRLHHDLKHIHSELMPAWEQFRNAVTGQQTKDELPDITSLEQHLKKLDQLCRSIPLK